MHESHTPSPTRPQRVSALVLELVGLVNAALDALRPECPRIGRQISQVHDRKRGRTNPALHFLTVVEAEAKAGATEYRLTVLKRTMCSAMDVVYAENRRPRLTLHRGRAA